MPYQRTYNHRRNLPHIQNAGKPIFLTFGTYRRWLLPELARDEVFACCMHEDKLTIDLYAAIVMPDHVHLLFVPLLDATTAYYSLAEIVNSVKSAAAHRLNRVLSRKGTVWQEEYFDHLVRSSEGVDKQIEYIRMNPVRKGLVKSPGEYRWLYVKK